MDFKLKRLQARHRKAARLKANGMIGTEIARELGVHYFTLRRWLCCPLFQAEVRKYETELHDEWRSSTVSRANRATNVGMGNLLAILETPLGAPIKNADGSESAPVDMRYWLRAIEAALRLYIPPPVDTPKIELDKDGLVRYLESARRLSLERGAETVEYDGNKMKGGHEHEHDQARHDARAISTA